MFQRILIFLLALGPLSQGPAWARSDRAAPIARAGRAPVEALQRAALRAAHLDGASYAGQLARLHLSALLPQVSVSIGRRQQVAEALRPWGGADLVQVSAGDRESFSVLARVDLSRLAYAREETALRESAQRAAREGRALAAEVARVYFQREALLGRPLDGAGRLRVAELTATLEGLTGLRGLASTGVELPAELPEEGGD
jgi:hypothetical protein